MNKYNQKCKGQGKSCPILAFIKTMTPVIAISFILGSAVYIDFDSVYTFITNTVQYANILNIFR